MARIFHPGTIFFALLAALVPLEGAVPEHRLPEVTAAWNTYIKETEARIQRESVAPLRPSELDRAEIRKMDNGRPAPKLSGAMIHHWAGAIWIPDVNLEQVLDWVQDYDRHHAYFPEVERSQLVSRNGDRFQIYLRLVRTKIVTVRYDTYHTVTYRRQGPARVTSHSVSTRIAELAHANTTSERAKTPKEDKGFLWGLNSYWSFSEEENGVLVECETVSLSRSIPAGLGWLVGRYVDSVPRESLESTLASIRNGVAMSMKSSKKEIRK